MTTHRCFLLSLGLGGLIALGAHAAALPPVPLWKGQAPGDTGSIGPEHDTTTAKDGLVSGRRVMRITDITAPELTVYRPPKAKQNGSAVLVFPGGGYHILAWDLEGTEICEWLNTIGVTGVLVKYRVPAREGTRRTAPLQDAQRALGMVRARAAEWGIDPKRIGVLGFSAGAHLSAWLSNNFEKRAYDRVDAADDVSCRPDFTVLIYPGGLTAKDTEQLNPEFHPDAGTPPSFIVQTEDDGVRVENSLAYYRALKAAKVPVEMHLYPAGGHGYGLRASKNLVVSWPRRAAEWMASQGVLAAR
ncbi:MAG TPA: alpha/beta hydrolase [Bryobacteraceae bacterium]|nr:alpha/beta hydrolase [Bryobacteraceae bacterium]